MHSAIRRASEEAARSQSRNFSFLCIRDFSARSFQKSNFTFSVCLFLFSSQSKNGFSGNYIAGLYFANRKRKAMLENKSYCPLSNTAVEISLFVSVSESQRRRGDAKNSGEINRRVPFNCTSMYHYRIIRYEFILLLY